MAPGALVAVVLVPLGLVGILVVTWWLERWLLPPHAGHTDLGR